MAGMLMSRLSLDPQKGEDNIADTAGKPDGQEEENEDNRQQGQPIGGAESSEAE